MKTFKCAFVLALLVGLLSSATVSKANGQSYGDDDPNKKIIKSGLLGAGTGAIAAGASGGNAGKGALIGAGTNVIGGALLDSLTGPSPSQRQAQPVYVQQASAPVYAQQSSYSSYPVQTRGTYQQVEPAPVYVQRQPVYYQPPQEDPNKKIIKNGLLGAGVGALSASASGGKAGKGALIGAGTNVIGGALLDSLMGGGSQPQPPQEVYVQQPVYSQAPGYAASGGSANSLHKKIIRKYDKDGNVVSEEEVWE